MENKNKIIAASLLLILGISGSLTYNHYKDNPNELLNLVKELNVSENTLQGLSLDLDKKGLCRDSIDNIEIYLRIRDICPNGDWVCEDNFVGCITNGWDSKKGCITEKAKIAEEDCNKLNAKWTCKDGLVACQR